MVGLFGSALADQGPTEEELVAPLVMKQNCWGGIIRFILDNERFEVDDAVCGDGNCYHLGIRREPTHGREEVGPQAVQCFSLDKSTTQFVTTMDVSTT